MDWYEKYDPTTIDEIILPDRIKNLIRKSLYEKDNSKHFIFHSKNAGVGKTSLTRLVSNELNKGFLLLKAGGDDRGKYAIIDKLDTFSGKKHKNGKIVLIDEGHNLSTQAQFSLQNTLDACKNLNTTIILTCNNYDSLNDYIKSRMTYINFDFLESKEEKKQLMKEMIKRLMYVLNQENVDYDKKAISKLVKNNFPSFRDILKIAQSNYYSYGNLNNIDENKFSLNLNLIENIKEKNFKDFYKFIIANEINNSNLFSYIVKEYERLYPKNIKTLSNIIILSNKYQNQYISSPDKDLNIYSYIVEVYKILKTK